MSVMRYPGLPILLLCCATAPVLAQQDDGALWTTQPTHIDRASQTYERLPAKVVARETRIWIVVPQRIKVVDNRSFSAGETIYELSHIRPLHAKRLCQAVEGGRWACGRMASIFLGNLVRGKRLLCDVVQNGKKMALSHCVAGSRDIASEIVAQGFGMAEGDAALLAVQTKAQKLAAKGLWRNPVCATDFDHC